MRRDWDPEDLIGYWTLLDSDWRLVANKTGATRLGFVALLKFFEIEGRFPQYAAEVPESAVGYLGEQVKDDPRLFAGYQWSGRTIEQHRAQIRAALGFRECSEADQRELTDWLAAEVCAGEQRREPLRDAVLAQYRVLRLEPPTFGQIARLVGSALTVFEKRFCTMIEQRLDAVEVSGGLEALYRGRLQVVENWNSGNVDLHYGKNGDLAGADRETVEVSMLALHLLQSALVHVNTALLQVILAEPEWAARMTEADQRALTPLFWTHVNLYGRFDLDMDTRLGLEQALATVGRRVIPPQRSPAPGGVTTTAASGENAG